MKSYTNVFILLFMLIVTGFLYKRFEDKLQRNNNTNSYESIQQYLLNEHELSNSKKPILWIHVPYEYNSRNWDSRSSYDLNQPYLYLTVKSILKFCDQSFTICIIDDNTFKKLIPTWDINMTAVSDPILTNIRMLGLAKLLYIYGGLICPISFVCIKSLEELYSKGISNESDSMFVCEMVDRTSTSDTSDFCPSLLFCGAPKKSETVNSLCEFIERTMSHDFTADSRFKGEYNRWIRQQIGSRRVKLIDGKEIGVKTTEGKQIILDDLMSNHYLKLDPHTYGIYIPATEVLRRLKFEWFARLTEKEVLESDTIIGNYLLLSVSPDEEPGEILAPIPSVSQDIISKFVNFWKTPLYPGLYMIDNHIGSKVPHTGR